MLSIIFGSMNPRMRYNPAENSFEPPRVNRVQASSDAQNSASPDVPQTPTADPSQIRRAALSQADRDAQAQRVDAIAARLGQQQSSGIPEMMNQIAAPQASAVVVPAVASGMDLDVETFLRAQQASQTRRNAVASPLESSLLGQMNASGGSAYSQFNQTPDRSPAPYIIGQETLFNTPGEDVRPPQNWGAAIYPEVGYEQEQIPRRPRTFEPDKLKSYIAEGRARAAAEMGTQGVDPRIMTPMEQNRVDARTAEQINIGAPIVPYDGTIPAVQSKSNPFTQLIDGLGKGFEYQHLVGDFNPLGESGGSGEGARYSRSYLADRLGGYLPADVQQKIGFDNSFVNSPYLYLNKPIAEKIGIEIGRIAGDVTGNGTRKLTWNMHPEDMANTFGGNALQSFAELNPALRRTAAWGATGALGVMSGNYNPLNLMEGGRAAGYQAVTPTDEDLTKSENPVLDLALYRGMFGRSGKLLPWEQFHQERPDVAFEDFDAYKQYLRDPGFLGLAKATGEGIDGPEARVMGYRVTPLGALSAAGVLGGAIAAGRFARRMN
jgi:hypothetical protein